MSKLLLFLIVAGLVFWWASRRFGATPTGSVSPATRSGMTDREAREVLGLEPDATREQIIEAHRRLMQKVHPDLGGSTYLAKQLNEAKRVLLDKR